MLSSKPLRTASRDMLLRIRVSCVHWNQANFATEPPKMDRLERYYTKTRGIERTAMTIVYGKEGIDFSSPSSNERTIGVRPPWLMDGMTLISSHKGSKGGIKISPISLERQKGR